MHAHCPRSCSGGGANRQSALSVGQLMRLSIDAQKRVEEAAGAMRCSYCGCVHIADGDTRQAIGTLDGGVSGSGWYSTM